MYSFVKSNEQITKSLNDVNKCVEENRAILKLKEEKYHSLNKKLDKAQKDYEKAIKFYERSMEIREHELGLLNRVHSFLKEIEKESEIVTMKEHCVSAMSLFEINDEIENEVERFEDNKQNASKALGILKAQIGRERQYIAQIKTMLACHPDNLNGKERLAMISLLCKKTENPTKTTSSIENGLGTTTTIDRVKFNNGEVNNSSECDIFDADNNIYKIDISSNITDVNNYESNNREHYIRSNLDIKNGEDDVSPHSNKNSEERSLSTGIKHTKHSSSVKFMSPIDQPICKNIEKVPCLSNSNNSDERTINFCNNLSNNDFGSSGPSNSSELSQQDSGCKSSSLINKNISSVPGSYDKSKSLVSSSTSSTSSQYSAVTTLGGSSTTSLSYSLLIAEFEAFPNIVNMPFMRQAFKQASIELGEGICISEPVSLPYVTTKGDEIFASISHTGVFASYNDSGEMEIVSLVTGKKCRLYGCEDWTMAAFYDKYIILLTSGLKLRETCISTVFAEKSLKSFVEIPKSKKVSCFADVSLLNTRRTLIYGDDDSDYIYEYNVDDKQLRSLGIKSFPHVSMCGIMLENIKSVYCGYSDSYSIHSMDMKGNDKMLYELINGNPTVAIVSESAPEDLHKALIFDGSGRYCINKKMDFYFDSPFKYQGYISIVRMYQDYFAVYDANTSSWVVVRIFVP